MKRRFFTYHFFCAIFLYLFLMAVGFGGLHVKPLYADGKMDLVLSDANEYIYEQYGVENYYPSSVTVGAKEYPPSEAIYDRYKIIAYWNDDSLSLINPSPTDGVIASAGDSFYDVGDTIYRYLGYDKWGNKVYNPMFPVDRMSFDPSGSSIVTWPLMENEVWSDIVINPEKADIKAATIENFKKSLLKHLKEEVIRFFLYRTPSIGSEESYLNNWTEYFLQELEEDISSKINVVMLPTKNSNGLAMLRRSTGYYLSIPLIYQEDTDAFMRICHIAVESDGDRYRIAEGYHSINDFSDYRILKNGSSISVDARESEAYRCIGYYYFDNVNSVYQEPSAGDPVPEIFSASSFSYEYNYDFSNDRPVLVFYYERINENPIQDRRGEIVVSSDVFDVSRSIPTGEDVRIEVNVDSVEQSNLIWAKIRQRVDIPVLMNFETHYKVLGEVSLDVEYHKLHDYSIYSLQGARVHNEKLRPVNSIYIRGPQVPEPSVRTYSQNILMPLADLENLELSGNSFLVSGERIDPRNIDEMNGGYIDGYDGGSIPVFVIKPGRVSPDQSLLEYFPDSFYPGQSVEDDILEQVSSHSHIEVRNDSVSIGGRIVSSGNTYMDIAPEPSKPQPQVVTVLRPLHKIEDVIKNGLGETRGQLIYKLDLGTGPSLLEYEILGNDVFVHTPTVNETSLSDEGVFDQRVQIDNDYPVVPIDHIMKLDVSAIGNHKDEVGYGSSDYTKYTRVKVLDIPFDSYVSLVREDLEGAAVDRAFYVPAHSFTYIEPEDGEVYFKAATWVDEGEYKISTYNIAKNSDINPLLEDGANLNPINYGASQEIDVAVVGRLFDFFVERVYDPAYLSEDMYWTSGALTKESQVRTRYLNVEDREAEDLIIPVMSGKSPLSTAVDSEVKLGYPFIFSVKTMGNFFSADDVIIGGVDFYHIDETGNIDMDIEVFYREEEDLIRVGSDEDELNNMVIYRSLAGAEGAVEIKKTEELLRRRYNDLIQDNKFFKDLGYNPTFYDSILSPDKYLERVDKPVFAYSPRYWVLSHPFRSFIGREDSLPVGVDPVDSEMSVQKWIGVYSLPETTLIFKRNSDGTLDFSEPISGGAIGVRFEINLSKNNNISGPHLTYLNDNYNGWAVEGYNVNQWGLTLPQGTVILYSVDHNSDEDRVLQ